MAFERLAKVYELLTGPVDASEVAALLSSLACDEAANINGAIITSDARVRSERRLCQRPASSDSPSSPT
jgi:hypothetical protein